MWFFERKNVVDSLFAGHCGVGVIVHYEKRRDGNKSRPSFFYVV